MLSVTDMTCTGTAVYFAQVAKTYAPNRIRELRRERGLTLEQVAHAVSDDTTSGTIHKLEQRQRALSLDWMHLLAKALDASVHDLIDGAHKVRQLPRVGRIAAGAWQEAVEEPDGYIAVPDEGLSGREFVLQVNGDSMNLVVQDGGWVIVDPEDVDLVAGRLYAIRNAAGEATFKRFELDPPRLVPCSTNAEHQPIQIGREPFTVIGRVKRAWFDL